MMSNAQGGQAASAFDHQRTVTVSARERPSGPAPGQQLRYRDTLTEPGRPAGPDRVRHKHPRDAAQVLRISWSVTVTVTVTRDSDFTE